MNNVTKTNCRQYIIVGRVGVAPALFFTHKKVCVVAIHIRLQVLNAKDKSNTFILYINNNILFCICQTEK